MTRGQITALRKHADQLDRRAEVAVRQYEALRAKWSHYVTGDGGLVMEAARAADDAARAARDFRRQLAHIDTDGGQ